MGGTLTELVRARYRPRSIRVPGGPARLAHESGRLADEVAGRWERAAEALLQHLARLGTLDGERPGTTEEPAHRSGRGRRLPSAAPGSAPELVQSPSRPDPDCDELAACAEAGALEASGTTPRQQPAGASGESYRKRRPAAGGIAGRARPLRSSPGEPVGALREAAGDGGEAVDPAGPGVEPDASAPQASPRRAPPAAAGMSSLAREMSRRALDLELPREAPPAPPAPSLEAEEAPWGVEAFFGRAVSGRHEAPEPPPSAGRTSRRRPGLPPSTPRSWTGSDPVEPSALPEQRPPRRRPAALELDARAELREAIRQAARLREWRQTSF